VLCTLRIGIFLQSCEGEKLNLAEKWDVLELHMAIVAEMWK
jgi:hypothetical protein